MSVDYEREILRGIYQDFLEEEIIEAESGHPIRSRYKLITFVSSRRRKAPREVVFIVDRGTGSCWHVNMGDPARNGVDVVAKIASEAAGIEEITPAEFIEILGYYRNR